jgi:hypothetical protein
MPRDPEDDEEYLEAGEFFDGGDEFFDGVEDFSDEDVRHDGWREDAPRVDVTEHGGGLPAPASLETAGELEDDDAPAACFVTAGELLERHSPPSPLAAFMAAVPNPTSPTAAAPPKAPSYSKLAAFVNDDDALTFVTAGEVEAAAALVGFGDTVEDDDDERESCFAESPRAHPTDAFDSDDEHEDARPGTREAQPAVAYELLASIVASLAWRKEQALLMSTFIKWLEVAGDAAAAAAQASPPASPSKFAGRPPLAPPLAPAAPDDADALADARRAVLTRARAVAAAEADVARREERCAETEARAAAPDDADALADARRAVLTRARAVAAAEADVVRREARCAEEEARLAAAAETAGRQRAARLAAEADVQRWEERLAAAEAAVLPREESLLKAEAALARREAALRDAEWQREAALRVREGELAEHKRRLSALPPVHVEPSAWVDAVSASAALHLKQMACQVKEMRRRERRTAKRGKRVAALVVWRRAEALGTWRGIARAFGTWAFHAKQTPPSSKQKRCRAARSALEARAGPVLDGVHAHYAASRLVRGGLRKELTLEKFWALARDFQLAPAFASYAYLMHLARDVLRGDSALSREQFGRALAQLALEAAGKAGEAPAVAVARVLDCMETSQGLAKCGLGRALKFRHG